jgi:hypothetical protein
MSKHPARKQAIANPTKAAPNEGGAPIQVSYKLSSALSRSISNNGFAVVENDGYGYIEWSCLVLPVIRRCNGQEEGNFHLQLGHTTFIYTELKSWTPSALYLTTIARLTLHRNEPDPRAAVGLGRSEAGAN